MDKAHITFKGPTQYDKVTLQSLPPTLAAYLQEINGFIVRSGELHVRGACLAPAWHSLKSAMQGPRAIHLLFPAVLATDIPFAQDALGNQFLLRGENLFRLRGETGQLEPLEDTLDEFLSVKLSTLASSPAAELLARFRQRGNDLQPGELLNVVPPLVSEKELDKHSLIAVSSDDQLAWLAKVASSIKGNEMLMPERPLPARDLILARISGLIEFKPGFDEFINSIMTLPTTVIAGGVNSGKSLLLKLAKARLGASAYFVATNRFYHVYHFSTGLRDPEQVYALSRQFVQAFSQEQQNSEQNLIDLNQIIIGLPDNRRAHLFALCSDLLGCTISLESVDPSNLFSPHYIAMDGQNVALGSTGTRLLMTIIGICFDERFSTLLVDEPELGLSPKVQDVLATLLLNPSLRLEKFPHLEQVIIATHSHLFLDRANISNNFVISKAGKTISIEKVQTISDLHRLQFNLLGNSLESLFFPSAIVIVEGKSDHHYIDRVLQLTLPSLRLTVLQASGDVKAKVHAVKETLGDLAKSPYRDRLFVVLDKVHQSGLAPALEAQGVNPQNVVVWDKNGIEYYYPKEILAKIFSCGEDSLVDIPIQDDVIEINGIRRTKAALSEEVTSLLTSSASFPPEMVTKLIERIAAVTS